MLLLGKFYQGAEILKTVSPWLGQSCSGRRLKSRKWQFQKIKDSVTRSTSAGFKCFQSQPRLPISERDYQWQAPLADFEAWASRARLEAGTAAASFKGIDAPTSEDLKVQHFSSYAKTVASNSLMSEHLAYLLLLSQYQILKTR